MTNFLLGFVLGWIGLVIFVVYVFSKIRDAYKQENPEGYNNCKDSFIELEVWSETRNNK